MPKTLPMWLLFLVILALALHPSRAQQGRDPVLVTDLLKIRSISGVDLSEDGKKAIFNVTSIEPETGSGKEYRYENQVWMVSLEGNGRPRQLTAKENSSQAVLSPDGNSIAFVRNVDGRPQVFLLPLTGGEARQLTTHRFGASAPRWSPDGKKIARLPKARSSRVRRS